MIHDLNDDNFIIYAMKAYDKPNCVMSEFEEDLKRIKYVKRLINRYRTYGEDELKERLILNHIIILSNVFGIEATVKMLFFKIEPDNYSILKTFLLFLNYMPKVVQGVNGSNIVSSDITIDLLIGKKLRTI